MSDRKYRHRGYQDDDREEKRPRPDRGAGNRGSGPEGGPRGRGLGKPTASVFKCARCGKSIQGLEIGPETLCPGCSSPLHSCSNCRHFNTGAPFECRKPIPARIQSKTKANHCEYFEPKAAQEMVQERRSNDPRAAFDALFKK